jgi:hypothetical protein
MATLVFVEGLWRTGKSYLVKHLRTMHAEKDGLLVHEGLEIPRSARHAPYLIIPSLFNQNHVFDGSPIGLKAISDPSVGLYNYPDISPEYWDDFFRDWLRMLKEGRHRVIVIYFRPFSGGELTAFSGIQQYAQKSRGTELMVHGRKCSLKRLGALHNRYVEIITSMKQQLGRAMEYYHVEYQDIDDAMDALQHEGLIAETDSIAVLP